MLSGRYSPTWRCSPRWQQPPHCPNPAPHPRPACSTRSENPALYERAMPRSSMAGIHSARASKRGGLCTNSTTTAESEPIAPPQANTSATKRRSIELKISGSGVYATYMRSDRISPSAPLPFKNQPVEACQILLIWRAVL